MKELSFVRIVDRVWARIKKPKGQAKEKKA
jgi:hypothetical protein